MPEAAPFRLVATVVGLLAGLFALVLIAVWTTDGTAFDVLTVPLVVVIPALAGIAYWHYIRR